jgi:hypothetical protein
MKWLLRRFFMPYQSLISSRPEEDIKKALDAALMKSKAMISCR